MARQYAKAAGNKVERAMKKRKAGTLRSGRSGKKVTSRKQAIAIGLSEARAAGKTAPKKTAGKKAAKTTTKKAAKKASSKRSSSKSAKKTTGRKASTKATKK